jgi:hypothetical protein
MFFLGSEDVRKIFWVDWDFICLGKEVCGFGVRRFRELNVALLDKWCWRMLVDREGLWFRVLKVRYGVDGGCVKDGGRDG